MLGVLFVCLIYLVSIMLVIFCVKVLFKSIALKRLAKEKDKLLQETLISENLKFKRNNENILMIDNLNNILFNRIFKITQDVLLVQKFIFENDMN